ncbi:MAG: amidohydrolase family protein, partial [Pseudomonadota bacterium]
RVAKGPDAMSARQALRLATRGGAEVLGRGAECGQIAPGCRADIAIWDVSGIDSAGSWDPAALVLAGPTKVRDLIVEGRRIVADGHLVSFDLDAARRDQSRLVAGLQ